MHACISKIFSGNIVIVLHDNIIQSGMFCEDYPVLNYTLEIEGSSSNVITHSTLSQHYNFQIGNLSEDREYSFRVLATNAVGTVSSSNISFCELHYCSISEYKDNILCNIPYRHH